MTDDARTPAAPTAEAIPQDTTWSIPLVMVLVVVILAGALFGYDQGVISGALEGIKKQFGLSAFVIEMVTSWVTLGALGGSLAGGDLADRLGRRLTILIAAVLFVAGAALESVAPDVVALVGGRFLVGFGVGIAAVAAPLYAAEIAPAHLRGRFVSAYQLAITLGIFVSYFVDAALADQEAWRIMLGVSAVPAALLVVAILLSLESPRWLLKAGRVDAARDALHRLRPEVDPEPGIRAIEAQLREQDRGASWGEVFDPRWRRPLVVGLGLAIFQQITGINAIIYYADEIFAAAGFATTAQQTAATTWAIGGVNVVATLIAIAFIDRLGRRPLLLAGLVGMSASLTVVGFAFRSLGGAVASQGPTTAGIVTLVALVTFIISFAFSLGPVVWTVINEIFPGQVRGRAVAVATAVNWGCAFLVSEFFLSVVALIGAAATFWVFAFFCAAGFVWVHTPRTGNQRPLSRADRGLVGPGRRPHAMTDTAGPAAPLTAEEQRLAAARAGTEAWRRWGPYLSERQWGTVREDYSADGTAWEYLPHDHARSRAYRWGEDGIAGISDDRSRLCFALALWNGTDPILKERMFGLTGNEGNHGEDVKEYYFYLDNLPSHAYMKYLYKYPQQTYPYDDLVAVNRTRTRNDPEYELLDTGIFDGDRYFDVFVEYAKAGPEDILIRITAANRGLQPAPLHLLPTLWFRNDWSWNAERQRPRIAIERTTSSTTTLCTTAHGSLSRRWLHAELADYGDLHRERDEPRAPFRRHEPVAVREGCIPRVCRQRQERRRQSRAHRLEGRAASISVKCRPDKAR